MYQNILIPLDPAHFDDANQTLEIAKHLKSKEGKLTLLSVVEEIPTYVASQIPEELLVNANEHAMKGLKALAKRRGIDANVIVRTGHAAATIKAVQKEHNCDLIIISSHKPTTVDYVLGSTASKVVRRAQCPVFVTR